MSKTVFLFSGQGGQYHQMGRSLFEQHPVFRREFLELSRHLMAHGGPDLVQEVYGQRPKSEVFDKTSSTHPALFIVETSLARTLMEEGITPDILLGSSMGEFVAAAVSGAVDAREMLLTLWQSACVIENECPEGQMLAVLGSADSYLNHVELRERVSLAAMNGNEHYVLSGSISGIQEAQRQLEKMGLFTVKIPVKHAFHSPDMDLCADRVAQLFKALDYRQTEAMLYSCRTQGLLKHADADHYIKIGRDPMHFLSTLQTLLRDHGPDLTFIDVSPSPTLHGYVRSLLARQNTYQCFASLSPMIDDLGWLQKIKSAYKKNATKRNSMSSTVVNADGRLALVFAGQGAQQKGMGQSLFARYPEMVQRASQLLGWSVEDVCLNNPNGCLQQTQYTQAAMYVCGALHYLDREKSGQPMPSIVAGHSLGEFIALFAAGVFDFETGLALVKLRAELMTQASDGAMAAILGLSAEEITEVLTKHNLTGVCIANVNTRNQIVISGHRDQVVAAEPLFKNFIRLPVSGAFHSPLMEPARKAFAATVATIKFKQPKCQVMSNVTGKPHQAGEIGEKLIEQMTASVLWRQSIEWMLDQGIETFEEVSPRPVLSKMIADIRQSWVSKPKASLPPVKKNSHEISAETLGSEEFRQTYNTRLSLVCGGMVHGIASVEMVVTAGKAGILAFFGTGGLPVERVESAIRDIQSRLPASAPYGMNLLNGPKEDKLVELYLQYGIPVIEASAYIKISSGLVRYRLNGLRRDGKEIVATHRVIAKLSRPEVALEFLAPAPAKIVADLLKQGLVTAEQVEWSRHLPMADDICVEADSGGHTDQGVAAVLLPTIQRLRDQAQNKYGYRQRVRVGAGGGIGTPEAALSMLALGADFLTIGSINQCTPEAGTSDLVKDMLGDMGVQDTAYAPAGDMFELGARVQVLRRGVLFPARANRLYELYTQYTSLDHLPSTVRRQIEEKYFQKSFEDVWADCVAYHSASGIAEAEAEPRRKMAMIFRWYFGLTNRLALAGDPDRKVDFQIHCGPSLGAFNSWVAESEFASWRHRRVDRIAHHLMNESARCLQKFIQSPFSHRNVSLHLT